MAEHMGQLRRSDPREYGYRMGAGIGFSYEYFLSRIEELDFFEKELAIEGWNEAKEEGF